MTLYSGIWRNTSVKIIQNNLHETPPNHTDIIAIVCVNSHLLVDGYKLTSTFINLNNYGDSKYVKIDIQQKW